MGARVVKTSGIILGLVGVAVLSGCAKDDPILPGKREGIRSILTEEIVLAEADPADDISQAISLPAATRNAEWTQAIGSPGTRIANPALSRTPQRVWSVGIGAGDGRKNRITADPVVADGRVYTLDAVARVSAVTTDGSLSWTRDLLPAGDGGSDASGGGLAYGGGKLFVNSGFGLVTALNPATGEMLWQQNLRATGTGAPSVYGDLVYLVAGDDVAWALDTDTGRIAWQLAATPDLNNVQGGPAPALTEKYAIFAFGANELQGAFRKGGLRLWDAQVPGQRKGYSGARVGDITGDPVIDGKTVYVGTHSGRTVALNLGNGERIWTATDGALGPVWPAGGSVFLVSDRNELLRLDAETGDRIWGRPLPFFTKERPRRQSEIFAHHGPIIAGGQLIVASSDGQIRFFDPESGAQTGSVDLPGGATSNPVVAGGTLYVVSTNGQLHAFR